MFIKDKLKLKRNFSINESCIADYLLENEEFIRDLSVRYIAADTYTSASTVIRLCKKMGYEGFNDFKDEYIKELKYYQSHFKDIDPNYPFSSKDKNMVVINKIATLYKETIDDAVLLMENDKFIIATNILKSSKIIYICSAGVQADIAYDFKEKMIKIGKNVIIDKNLHETFYSACYCEKDSCFLLISYSGETERVLKIAKKVKERNIPVIAITSFGKNSLSSMIKCSLYLSTREKLKSNLGSFGINISTMLLLDSLYANCFNMDYEKNLSNKIKYSSEYEQKRNSNNPILHEE